MEIGGLILDGAQERALCELADPSGPDVYLWGPPGRGKTWLVDAYLARVDRKRLMRRHFHEFFADVHRGIRARGSLTRALDDLLDGIGLVCFDEFHVHDPADGQYVTALLDRVHDLRIRTILTSNYPPAQLLPNPLFHSMFEPTIERISQRFRVVECDGGTDYRRAGADRVAGAWLCPGTAEQFARLGLSSPGAEERTIVSPAGHAIVADRAADGQIWFRFDELCETPTAAVDYLPLATDYQRWVITGVPGLIDAAPAQRFANLVDVLWEKHVEVVVAAATPPDRLTAHGGAHDLNRMVSRLSQLPCEASVAVGE